MAANDRYPVEHVQSAPPRHGFAIVPDDANELAQVTTKLTVGATGDVRVLFADDTVAVVLPNLQAGLEYSYRVKKVFATGTTAGNLVGHY